MTTTDPFDTALPVPGGCYLLLGKYLTDVARAAKVPFRKAERAPRLDETATHAVPVGLLLREEDRERMNAALERSRLRKAKEAAALAAVRKL